MKIQVTTKIKQKRNILFKPQLILAFNLNIFNNLTNKLLKINLHYESSFFKTSRVPQTFNPYK